MPGFQAYYKEELDGVPVVWDFGNTDNEDASKKDPK